MTRSIGVVFTPNRKKMTDSESTDIETDIELALTVTRRKSN